MKTPKTRRVLSLSTLFPNPAQPRFGIFVARSLEAGSDTMLLDLALEAGFASKATFNRAFMQRYGMSPSTYRARLES